LEKLAQYASLKGYKWLLMQALSWAANNGSLHRDYSQALDYDSKALLLANEIADTYMQQKILAQLAQEYGRLASPGRSLGYIQRALSLTDLYYVSLRQMWRNYNFAADIFYELKLFSAAADCGRESLRLATDKLSDPSTTHSSLVRLGRLYGGLNDFREAIRLAEESLQVSQSLPSGLASQAMAAFSNLQLAHLEKNSGDCRSALSHYEEAIRFYEPDANTRFSVNYYNSRKGRLGCYVALGEDLQAQTELPRVLELFEEHRATIVEEENRNTFFDKEQSVYDTAIEYAYSKHDGELAFNYSERSRARSLLDTLVSNAKMADSTGRNETVLSHVAESLTLNEIRSRMSKDVQLVQYAVLPERLVIWVVSPSQLIMVDKQIPAAKLNSLITDFMKSVTSGPKTQREETRELAEELYEALIRPIEPSLDPRRPICFVPDKAITKVPFAALVVPQTQNYLIEKYSLLYAPSASMFVLSTELAERRVFSGAERLISLGNPAFDHKAHPELADLSSASREAQTVAKFYPNGNCLLGQKADKPAFVREMARADVIHFAGHYLPDEASHLQSKLLLAGNDRNDGDFTVSDIFNHTLKRPRLIVLSACRTELDRYYDGEGAIGITRSFLGAGIPVVVASQWQVDSEATAQLMIAFHRYRTEQKLATQAALRQAQLYMFQNEESRQFREPYYWAGFAPFGGYATF
jgi:CHAT domain-containing protein